jgi:hypothetical protein
MCSITWNFMIYFDSDMTKSTNTVVYFDWKTVIYIYGIFKLFLLRKVKRDKPECVLVLTWIGGY